LSNPLQAETMATTEDNKNVLEGPVTTMPESFENPDVDSPTRSASLRSLLRSSSAFAISIILHAMILVVLGVLTVSSDVASFVETIIAEIRDELVDDELVSVELEEELEPADELSEQLVDSSPALGIPGAAPGSSSQQITLNKEIVQQFDTATSEVVINSPFMQLPSTTKLLNHLPEGALGDPRQIVDDYQQAIDRITQEVMWMLDRGDVMLIWCFDQSESMKNDQQEIRQRINRVYDELGLSENAKGDQLLTAVTSFGQGYLQHTRRPTSDLEQVRTAIDSVPIDPSGKELMCQSVGTAIRLHRQYSKKRQMAMVLVTDESGDPENNDRFLEAAIAEAKAAKCQIYVMGRESVFGYPYAFMRWPHPQTGNVHWLRIDRGPETAFVEQLQTNGFRRRHDAFSSGFGSYEQARMAQQTGGIFFMLPSVETNLVRGDADKRRYQLEAMYPYQPDLRSRLVQFVDRDRYPLRTFLWKVVNDLNPYRPEVAEIIEVRMAFSRNPQQFVQQVRESQAKAKVYLDYLATTQLVLEEASEHRRQEVSPRWMANYDLIHAQVIAYQARIYEYGASLEAFLQNPKIVPLSRPPNLTLSHWDVVTRKQTITGPISQPYVDKATELFELVISRHPGTPWAERAAQELKRGYGIDLRPDYDPPPRPRVSGPVIPIPKL
jgi:hypothetical protein